LGKFPTREKENKKMNKKLLTIFCILSFAISLFFGFSTVFGAEKEMKFRFGTASFPGLPTHTWTIKFAEVLKEKSNGKLIVEPIQERKLGGDKDMIELVRAGAVEMAHCSSALYDGFFPDLNALQMPFLINSYDQLQKVYLADYTKKLISALERLDLVPLGLIENGYRHIGNNVKAIYKPEDLKGIKIRVAETKMHQELFEGLGAIPVPISYGEIYTSLKTGVINGTEINATSASSEKLMEVLSYFSLTGHFFWPSIAFVNKGVWNSIPAQDQKLIEQVVTELVPWQIALCKDQDKKAMETMEKKGIKINQADTKAFFEGSKFIYDKYMKYPAVADFVKSVQAMQ
jgi:tripartite ATP-independent transporter DctP family solute receptor